MPVPRQAHRPSPRPLPLFGAAPPLFFALRAHTDAFPRGRHSSLVRSGTGGGARGEPGSAPQRRPLVSHDSLAAWAPLHRRNCIGGERLKILDLYEHRKAFRTSAAQGRGLRDESRAALQNHYSAGNGTFSRSFVVGPLNDCCAASAGLASGLSFHTWSDSRTDVTKNRPWHTGRGEVAAKNRSVEREHLEAYIRQLRSSYEGPKGGSAPKDKWTVPKNTAGARWEEYKALRQRQQLPVIGSKSLFEKLWRAHTEIVQIGATGHAKCDSCALFAAERENVRHDFTAEGRAKLALVEEKQQRHDSDHLGERAYAEDTWMKGEHGRVAGTYLPPVQRQML